MWGDLNYDCSASAINVHVKLIDFRQCAEGWIVDFWIKRWEVVQQRESLLALEAKGQYVVGNYCLVWSQFDLYQWAFSNDVESQAIKNEIALLLFYL